MLVADSRWAEPLPNGVVAIVHTHPNWERLPSTIDIRTSQRIHLPVYVVTGRHDISGTGIDSRSPGRSDTPCTVLALDRYCILKSRRGEER